MINVENAVKDALATALDFSNPDLIHMEDNLRTDLQLDSMSSLMFLMKLEENISGFFVDPETLHMSDLETVNSVVRYVNWQILAKDAHVH